MPNPTLESSSRENPDSSSPQWQFIDLIRKINELTNQASTALAYALSKTDTYARTAHQSGQLATDIFLYAMEKVPQAISDAEGNIDQERDLALSQIRDALENLNDDFTNEQRIGVN